MISSSGLTPDESAVSPIMPSNPAPSRSGSTRSAGRAYSYGSDEDAEARVPLQGRPAVQQASIQPQQQQQLQQRPQHSHQHPQLQQQQHHLPQNDHVVYDPPWDHINLEQIRSAHRSAQTSESDEDNRHALQRYSQAGESCLLIYRKKKKKTRM